MEQRMGQGVGGGIAKVGRIPGETNIDNEGRGAVDE